MTWWSGLSPANRIALAGLILAAVSGVGIPIFLHQGGGPRAQRGQTSTPAETSSPIPVLGPHDELSLFGTRGANPINAYISIDNIAFPIARINDIKGGTEVPQLQPLTIALAEGADVGARGRNQLQLILNGLGPTEVGKVDVISFLAERGDQSSVVTFAFIRNGTTRTIYDIRFELTKEFQPCSSGLLLADSTFDLGDTEVPPSGTFFMSFQFPSDAVKDT